MSTEMSKLWSDSEFLRIIGTPDANGAVCVIGEQTTPQPRAGSDSNEVTGVHKNGKVASPKLPPFQHPGDGEVVPVEQAFTELGKKSGVVLESGSHEFHQQIWQKIMGNEGDAPLAFKYAGRIRLDVMKLTPEQLERFKVMSNAQAAAIAIGNGNRNGSVAGDSDGTTTINERADTPVHPPNGNGNGNGNGSGAGGRSGNTLVSHPPPPPAQPAPAENPEPVFRYPPKPGDGEVVPIERAFDELGKNSGLVLESGSHDWHNKLWQEQLGNQGEAPLAFKYGGKIRVDIDRLTPEQLETFIKLDQAQSAAIAAREGINIGSKGSGGKGGAGGANGSGGAKGGAQGGNAGGAGSDPSHQAIAKKVDAYDAKVKKLQENFDGLQKKQASAGATKDLMAERAKLDTQQKALMQEGETLSMEMTAAAGQELQAAFRTANPKELLNIARGGLPGRATVGAMAGIAVTLATAYFIALDIRYILDADNAMEGLERAGQVGAGLALNAAELAVFQLVTKSNPVTGILSVVAGMCGDGGGACNAQDAQKRDEEAAKQQSEQERKQRKAIGDFLAKNVPGSVMWVEDEYKILNQKVWDETVKKIDQMQRQYRTDRKAGVHKRAHDLGMEDARIMGSFVHKDELKGWPEAKEGLVDELELSDEYMQGFKQANQKREAAMNRADQLGRQDGKLGVKAHHDDMYKWPEVNQLIAEGANPMFLYQELGTSYNDAFDLKTGKKSLAELMKD